MATLSSTLEKTVADHGDRPAIRQDDLVLTYAQLRDSARRAASLLVSLGVAPGDRVARHAAERGRLPDRLLRRARRRRHGGADEPDAEEPRGRLLPRRFRGQSPVRLA